MRFSGNTNLECFSQYTQYISQTGGKLLQAVLSGIVVGVLQHYGKAFRRNLNRFKCLKCSLLIIRKELKKAQQVQ
jgi:hypothetical protein